MGIHLDPEEIRRWLREGLVTPEQLGLVEPAKPKVAKKPKGKPGLVAPSYALVEGWHRWEYPIVTVSESNAREWRKRSNRVKMAREIVSRHMSKQWSVYGPIGDVWRAGQTVYARFTRLGGHALDAANVGPALKASEDAVCMMMGVNDTPPRWQATYHTQPGGEIGVRVELRTD